MPITGVGTLPDGTLTWVDANGQAINADGTPVSGNPPVTPASPAPNTAPKNPGLSIGPVTLGGSPAASNQASAASTVDTTTRDQLVNQLASANGGQIGAAAPVNGPDPKDPKGGDIFLGYHRYTFGNGSTLDIMPNGQVVNWQPSTQANQAAQASNTAANRAPTAEETQIAKTNTITIGSQVYGPDPNNPNGPWIPTSQSQQQQQQANAKTQADTAYTEAQTQAVAAKTALDNDPTNVALQQAKAQADIDFQKAQTQKSAIDAQVSQGQLGVQQGNLAINQAKLPGDIAAQQASTANTQATTQKTLAALNQPTVLNMGTGATTTYWDPAQQKMVTIPNPNPQAPTVMNMGTGRTTTLWNPQTGQQMTQPNQNWQPTTPGQMIQQLNDQATAQHATLNQQVQSGKLSPDAAASQFDQWWNDNIEPQKQDIAQAQADTAAKLAQTQAQTNYYQAQAANLPATLAETAASNAQRNFISAMPYMANQNAGSLLQQAFAGGKYDPSKAIQAFTFSGPSLQEIGRLGAAQALAHISPTAQAQLQQPGQSIGQPAAPGLPNLNQLLNQNQYGFGPGGYPGYTGGVPPWAGATPQRLPGTWAPGTNLMTPDQLAPPPPPAPVAAAAYAAPAAPAAPVYRPPAAPAPGPAAYIPPYTPAPPISQQALTGGQDLSGYAQPAPAPYPGVAATAQNQANAYALGNMYAAPAYVPNTPAGTYVPAPSTPYTDPTNTNWMQVVPGI